MSNAWIGVVSEAHVRRGVAGGFAQVCHGRRAPLARMRRGDWLFYYSPRTEKDGGEPVRAFTAMGQVVDEDITQVTVGDFCPFRRAVRYARVEPAPIAPLLPELHFAQHGSWGLAMRRGHFAIDDHDRVLIAQALGQVV